MTPREEEIITLNYYRAYPTEVLRQRWVLIKRILDERGEQ